jgi:peptidoglycan hydrolase-like protein with peptidoglycan-binding domain
MGLNSMLFTSPARDQKLENCLVSDAAHILEGFNDVGEHVRRIQIALNELEDFDLDVDSIYGQNTADAVQIYKNERGILAPGQNTADRIVGKGTIKSLDDEIAVLENSPPHWPCLSD